MTIAEWLFKSMQKLGDACVDSPRRDALVLLEDILNKDRTWVLSRPEEILDKATLNAVNKLIERRINREPLAYIRGRAWFYGRFFKVDSHVLIPRPESENIVEIVKGLNQSSIIDIGTGSGCLAVTLAIEIPGVKVTATDISQDALNIAKENAKTLKVQIDFVQSDLLSKVPPSALHPSTTIVANLPYVPDEMKLEPELRTEPELALFAGKGGMDLYIQLWDQINKLQEKPANIITESLKTQHSLMNSLASKCEYRLDKTEGLIQLFTASKS